ncbi:MAG TPA: heme ABC exporter ATP-binding protein CcmA [Bryobacteraceae bacterium]|nr:heme ABC exporter ATP-binding protein CcmA [Bryobacteraceae bacterium]
MPAVAIDGVWKYYGDYPALRDISFEIDAGSCVALLGRNGAGKTTLLKIMGGLSRAAKGRLSVLDGDTRTRAVRRRIGLLGHGIGVYEELSARENLEFFARLQGLPRPKDTAAEWLERTGLAVSRDTLVREFSRGMRQRLAVGRAFLHDPDLLLLDEPFTALDDRAIALLQKLLSGARARGATIVMSTHQLREALELATNVVLINRGRLAYCGPRTVEMLADPGWLYRNYGEA